MSKVESKHELELAFAALDGYVAATRDQALAEAVKKVREATNRVFDDVRKEIHKIYGAPR